MVEDVANSEVALMWLNGNKGLSLRNYISFDNQYGDPRIPKRAVEITDIREYFNLIRFTTVKSIAEMFYSSEIPIPHAESCKSIIYVLYSNDGCVSAVLGLDEDVLQIRDKINRYEFVNRYSENNTNITVKFIYPKIACNKRRRFVDSSDEEDAQVIDDWGDLAN